MEFMLLKRKRLVAMIVGIVAISFTFDYLRDTLHYDSKYRNFVVVPCFISIKLFHEFIVLRL